MQSKNSDDSQMQINSDLQEKINSLNDLNKELDEYDDILNDLIKDETPYDKIMKEISPSERADLNWNMGYSTYSLYYSKCLMNKFSLFKVTK